MPPGGEVGQAWWEADLKDEKLKAKLRELDALLRQHGEMSEQSLNRGWSQALDNAGRNLQTLGAKTQSVGNSMTRNLTVPIVGLGAATGKMALDFDTTMNRIVGLAKVPREAIAGIKDEVLAMGAEIGRSPQELAEAFYFVASAGFEADEAMEVLRISATAAAAGMGETQDIAKVLGGVINAYGKENITAARAGDVLTAAIQDGAAEASDFAGVIGFVVPVAASLGVSFDQVTAAMAAMTQVGISADTAATNLGQVMASLQKPTKEAEEALEGLGLSSAGLRQQLREEGLLATLRTLEERFEGNETAAALVFGNIRALRGVTALLGLDTEQLNSIFADTLGALGNLQTSYDETEGPQREMARSMAEIQATAIELGADVLPVVVDVLHELAGGAREFAQWWRSLDDDTKKFVVQMLAFIAVAGPLIRIVGTLASGVGGLLRVVAFLGSARTLAFLRAFGAGFTMALGPIGLMIAAVGALALAMEADFLGMRTRLERDIADMALNFGDMGAALHELEGEYGVSFQHVKDIVAFGMIEMNLTFEQAVARADRILAELPITAERHFKAYDEVTYQHMLAAKGHAIDETGALVDGVVGTLEDGAVDVGTAADGTMGEVDEAAAKARAAAIEHMRNMLTGLTSLFDSDESVRDAWQALIDRMDDPYTPAERKADLFSKATIANIQAAIKTGDPAITADTATLVNNMLGQFALLEPGALESGEAVPPAIQSGMDAQMSALITFIEQNVVGGSLLSLSLAEAEEVGLDGIWKYAQGMRRNRMVATAEARNVAFRSKEAMLEPDFYGGGQRSALSWASGFGSRISWQAAYGAGATIAAAAGLSVRGLSPPKEGPLKDIDTDALRVALAWVGGWEGAFGPASVMGGRLAGTMQAALTSAGASGFAFESGVASLAPPPSPIDFSAVPRGTVVHHKEVHLHTDGPVPVSTDDELTRLLDRTQWVADEGAWSDG